MSRTSVHDDVPHTTKYELFSDASEPKARAPPSSCCASPSSSRWEACSTVALAVGIAMGAAGSDVALETADVALMADDLAHLPFAVGLSRHTRGIIRQNVFVSLGVVAFLVPATILGLGIGPAVAVHEGSTLLVVINALRLLAYREPAGEAA